MAIKLADELRPMGDFPATMAEYIGFSDGETLQDKYNNKKLGGGDSSITLTQEEYDALTDEEKLNGLYYTYDTKRIYKNGVQYGASEPISLTMEEYKALKEAGAIDEQQEYLIVSDENGILLEAVDIGYNNAGSGIEATTVQGAIDKVAEKANGLISDTSSSTTNTYSSAKIDEKYGAYTFGTADTTQWLKLTLGNSSKFQSITITDQYGGKVEITGMADDGTYKSVKLVRYSYGDWNTYSATDYTFTSQNDANYKIRRLYYYPTNGCYYLEIRQWCTIKVSGTTTKPEMVTSLPAEASAMTSIPESNWGRIDDASTNTTSTWSGSKIVQQINNATAIKYDNVINANATKETDWSLAQGESHFYGRLLQLDGHLGSKSSTFSFLLFVKANYDNPTTVYVTQLAGMDDDRTNIAHTTYFELGVSSSGNLTIKNKSAVAASYRFI